MDTWTWRPLAILSYISRCSYRRPTAKGYASECPLPDSVDTQGSATTTDICGGGPRLFRWPRPAAYLRSYRLFNPDVMMSRNLVTITPLRPQIILCCKLKWIVIQSDPETDFKAFNNDKLVSASGEHDFQGTACAKKHLQYHAIRNKQTNCSLSN